tara:strand:- start:7394 stop:7618 length:225 start_codon:yes stop_codon:yes gene_type:complete
MRLRSVSTQREIRNLLSSLATSSTHKVRKVNMPYDTKKKTTKKKAAGTQSSSNFIGRTPPRKKQLDAQMKKMGL